MRQPAVTGVASTIFEAGCASDAVGDEEAHALLDADAAESDAAIRDDARDDLVGTLVLLPGPDFASERRLDQLAGAVLLESRADVGDARPWRE